MFGWVLLYIIITIKNTIMNENIDLTKILKNCPRGTKLYTPIWGEVTFVEVREHAYDSLYPIRIYNEYDNYINLAKDGRYLIHKQDSECILFPSKDQRDWSKFVTPWCKKERFDPKTLKPFDKVLVKCASIYNSNLVWRVGLFSYFHVEDDSIRVYTLGSDDNAPNLYVIPYNDNTKHLVNTTEEAPEYYRYWEN